MSEKVVVKRRPVPLDAEFGAIGLFQPNGEVWTGAPGQVLRYRPRAAPDQPLRSRCQMRVRRVKRGTITLIAPLVGRVAHSIDELAELSVQQNKVAVITNVQVGPKPL